MRRFVKNLGKDPALCPNGMDVAKLTQKKVLQILENGVRFGKWVLLENIGEVRKQRIVRINNEYLKKGGLTERGTVCVYTHPLYLDARSERTFCLEFRLPNKC